MTSALAALTCGAVAQDLAPEVVLLARIKAHLREELSHLPNYTCLETIARFHRESVHPYSLRRKTKPKMEALDTLRLEVAYSDRREWYAWPGAPSFREDHPAAFIGSGMIGNGAFALAPHNLFIADVATFTYRGEEAVGGRMAFRYDFRLPQWMKPLQISIAGGAGAAGEEGSFWVDPQSLDLLRLETRAAEIPAFLPLVAMDMTISYARTRIGEYNALLAEWSDLRMIELPAAESYDRFEFTHCRMFHTQSAIRFEADTVDPAKVPPDASGTVAPSPESERGVPALLPVAVRLTTPITENDTVGTPIEGGIAGDVRRRGKIVLPNGSVVRGRIRRLERFETGRYFIVGLEFTEVKVNGESLRFYADLLSIDKKPGIRPTLSRQVLARGSSSVSGGYRAATEEITLPQLPGVASFFVQGTTFTIPGGFRTLWRTRGLIR